jgi:hypothetical protein
MNVSKKFILVALACVVLSIAISTGANAYDQWGDIGVEEQGWFAGWACLSGAMCILPIILFVVGIIIAIWVYKDAEKRGTSGVLWLIIVLFTGIIGLIVWLVIRPPIGGEPGQKQQQVSPDRRCPGCGRSIPPDAQVCPYCGKDFKPPVQ